MSKQPTGEYHFGEEQVEEYCNRLVNFGEDKGMDVEEWLVLLYICAERLAHEYGIELEEIEEMELN